MYYNGFVTRCHPSKFSRNLSTTPFSRYNLQLRRRPFYPLNYGNILYEKGYNDCKEKCNRIGFNDVVWPCLNDIKVDDAWKIINEMINDYSKK